MDVHTSRTSRGETRSDNKRSKHDWSLNRRETCFFQSFILYTGLKIRCHSQVSRISLQDEGGHIARVNKLYTFNIGLDLLCNTKAAAHKIGVNLLRKGRHYFSARKTTPAPPARVNREIKCDC